MKRSELTQEELSSILSIYAQTKNYSAVGRLLDITPNMVSKIIEDYGDEVDKYLFTELSYCGPTPVEPVVKSNINPDWRKEMEKLYMHMVRVNGQL